MTISVNLCIIVTLSQVTREGCGDTKLCLASPDNCDPAGNGSCMFVSFQSGLPNPPLGTKIAFELRGDSNYFISVGLTTDLSQVTNMIKCSIYVETEGKIVVFLYFGFDFRIYSCLMCVKQFTTAMNRW